MEDTFTYSIQKSGYDFNQSDKMGSIDYEEFVDVFHTFKWKEQVGQANKCEPTVSVSNYYL